MTRNDFVIKRIYGIVGITTIGSAAAITFYLWNAGETLSLSAFWMVIVLFAPAILLSLCARGLSIKLLMGIVVCTQCIGLPWFMINQDAYTYSGWTAVKRFHFTLGELFDIYLPISAFLLLTVIFFITLTSAFRLRKLPRTSVTPKCAPAALHAPNNRKRRRQTFALLLFIILVVPLNMWMFRNGISLVGITPPKLPYRLAGLLHYLTAYIVPLVLFYLYSRTSRTALPACILALYALLLGLSQISRSTSVFALLPVLVYAVQDRRRTLLAASSVWVLFCVQIVTLLRNVVYLVVDQQAEAQVGEGLVSRFVDMVSTQIGNIDLAHMTMSMIGRIESPQSIVLGYQFNPDAIGGISVMLKRLIYDRWEVIDLDAYHLEWIGATLPRGFVSGGGLLSTVVSMIHANVWFVSLLALLVAGFLYLGEHLSRQLARKYDRPQLYTVTIMIYAIFVVIALGTVVFWGLIAAELCALVLPKIRLVLRRGERLEKPLATIKGIMPDTSAII